MVARSPVARGEVHLVRLDPTLGSEIRKKRPCLVVSPDELNQHLRPSTVAPMPPGARPTRGGFPVGSRTDPVLWRSINSAPWIRNDSSNDSDD